MLKKARVLMHLSMDMKINSSLTSCSVTFLINGNHINSAAL